MDTSLNISPDLDLPLDLITETVAILAKRGVGKTYTASVMTEEILKVGGHVVAIDPVGVWWGLRASANGEPSGGLQILILGGTHADLPLDATTGSAVADLIVSERLSCVLDFSLMTQEEMARFLAPFLDRLYQINREPLHLMVDEADSVAPQMPGRGETAMLAAMDRLVRRGRARGIGVTLITQRPAVLSKNVLTQIELMIALRLTSPNDRKAVDSWIQAYGTEEERHAVMGSLAKLDIGEAWFWSPAWLNLLKRVRIRKRQTFDSSSTPKIGQTFLTPRTLASIDLTQLQERFSASIVAASNNDPDHLRRRIDALEQQLRERPTETIVERHEVPILREGEAERLELAAESMTAMGKDLLAVAGEIRNVLAQNSMPDTIKPAVQLTDATSTLYKDSNASVADHSEQVQNNLKVTASQQRILDALAAFASLGVHEVARVNVAIWAKQSSTSSGYGNNLGRLRALNLISYPLPGYAALTAAGKNLAKQSHRIQSISDLHNAWQSHLSDVQARMLSILLTAHPDPVTKVKLALDSGQSATSSGLGNNLGRLRSLGLIVYPAPGLVTTTPLLHPPHLT